jgi:hypothetical protein
MPDPDRYGSLIRAMRFVSTPPCASRSRMASTDVRNQKWFLTWIGC